jgi:hypothetical protein
MDYNWSLHISDVDDLISCEGGHGSPEIICFDKSVREVNAPPKFVDDFLGVSRKFVLGMSTEEVVKLISLYSAAV